ncbi:MAG TPA: hypothetical protein VFS26_10400, partial [Solirubrobacterales bacterium]|nr:hypothetical protein [Solirubrobacterales bacterium]
KHLKTLGLAALAALALTAFAGASSASATEFHATGGTALNGVQVNPLVLTNTGQSLTCNTVVVSGSSAASGTSERTRVHPAVSNCTAFEISGAAVNLDGCEYELNANTNTLVLINCTNGRITVKVSTIFGNCDLDVPNQNGINNQTFINMGNTGSNTATLTWEANANNITAEVTESNGICPLTVGHHNNATLTGLVGIMGATGGTSF